MDGSVAEREWVLLRGIGDIAPQDIAMASAVANFPWFIDGANGYDAPHHLSSIASRDLEMARTLAGMPWLVDGVSSNEGTTLFYLDRIASTDLGFAWTVVNLPWFTDGVTGDEWAKVQQLESIASGDLELAQWLSGLPLSRDVYDQFLLRTYSLAANKPDVLRQILDQPWVQDGLDEQEAALMVVVLGEADFAEEAFVTRLLNRQFTHESKAVALPLTEEVTLSVFQTPSSLPGEDIPTAIQGIARALEGFMGLPLPTTNIIALIRNLPQNTLSFVGGRHYVSHISVNRKYGEDIEGVMSTITHEMAHYYYFTRPWFNEAFAHLMEGYVASKRGIQSMEEHRAEASTSVQRYCSPEDIATIGHAQFIDEHFGGYFTAGPGLCTRSLGLRFLQQALELMGEERLATALRELHLLREHRDVAAEKAIFQILLSNTPLGRQEEFRDLYQRQHGGPYTDPGLDRSDDHGDSEDVATEVMVGQAVEGSLDYSFDFDYFKIEAEGGQQFRLELEHGTLRPDSVVIFTGTGERSAGVKSAMQASSGPLIQWIVPVTGTYYVAVLNLRGDSGRYVLRIADVANVDDDHGDSRLAPTDIAIGEIVHGIVDDEFDKDFFRVSVVAGEVYSIKLIGGPTLLDCCIGLTISRDSDTGEFSWIEGSTRAAHVIVHGGADMKTGAYTLQVSRK